jgi:putative zinc ribbon protein
MSPYNDIDLACVCGERFTWSAGEQEFLNDLYIKGKIPAVNTPKRCPPCRQRKKIERENLQSQDQLQKENY